MVPVLDLNTSDEPIDGTPPGRVFQPPRYTTTIRDTTRVSLWSLLSTMLGTYVFDTEQGLDGEDILDPTTSDEERAAIVAEVVLGYPGVTGLVDGPTVTTSEDGSTVTIELTASAEDGPFQLSLSL